MQDFFVNSSAAVTYINLTSLSLQPWKMQDELASPKDFNGCFSGGAPSHAPKSWNPKLRYHLNKKPLFREPAGQQSQQAARKDTAAIAEKQHKLPSMALGLRVVAVRIRI